MLRSFKENCDSRKEEEKKIFFSDKCTHSMLGLTNLINTFYQHCKMQEQILRD